MSDKYFIDTNIFIYSFDTENPQKNDIAKKLIANALENGTGIISYQVIQEFLNVATQKFIKPLTFKDAQRYLNLIANALENGTGIISYQVIQEFLNVATQKFIKPLTFKDAQRYLNVVLEPLCEVFSSTELFHKALEIMDRWRFPFYDSLIISAALQADCVTLYTENMQHNQAIKDLTIKNPFIDSP